jgi:hypothetical protein
MNKYKVWLFLMYTHHIVVHVFEIFISTSICPAIGKHYRGSGETMQATSVYHMAMNTKYFNGRGVGSFVRLIQQQTQFV